MSEQIELPLPLAPGEVVHPWLAARGISVRGLPSAQTVVILRGPKTMRFHLSKNLVARERWTGDECRLEWRRNTPGLGLVISVLAGPVRVCRDGRVTLRAGPSDRVSGTVGTCTRRSGESRDVGL